MGRWADSCGQGGLSAIVDALRWNATLLELHLDRASLGPSEAETLATGLAVNQTLVTLGLRSNALADDGTAVLAKALGSAALRTLVLGGNLITDLEDLARALGSSGLTALDLRSNSLAFAAPAFRTLSHGVALTTLDVSACRLAAPDLGALVAALGAECPLQVRCRTERISLLDLRGVFSDRYPPVPHCVVCPC